MRLWIQSLPYCKAAMDRFNPESGEETYQVGYQLAPRLTSGDTVLFTGELGAGKTTMIRGVLRGLGYEGPVRSPTFNLISLYEARFPVMHADLYRLKTGSDLGLEDYLGTHLCLIEWPDRLSSLIQERDCWEIHIHFKSEGRLIEVQEPASSSEK